MPVVSFLAGETRQLRLFFNVQLGKLRLIHSCLFISNEPKRWVLLTELTDFNSLIMIIRRIFSLGCLAFETFLQNFIYLIQMLSLNRRSLHNRLISNDYLSTTRINLLLLFLRPFDDSLFFASISIGSLDHLLVLLHKLADRIPILLVFLLLIIELVFGVKCLGDHWLTLLELGPGCLLGPQLFLVLSESA